MTIRTTIPVTLQLSVQIGEDGHLSYVAMPDYTEVTAAAHLQADTKALAKIYAEATKSRLDENLVRVWSSSVHGRHLSYMPLLRMTKLHVLLGSDSHPTKFRCAGGCQIRGYQYIDADDLALIEKGKKP